MKLNDVRRFSAYVSTIYHSEYITLSSSSGVSSNKISTGFLRFVVSCDPFPQMAENV